MSIFTKPITQLAFADLEELLTERSVENVRLEFKRELPDKDEILKKLSSFANTSGGFVVIGAAAGGDGRITSLSGVTPQPNYKQTIIQWCFDGVFPPLDVEVSDGLPVAAAPNSNVCYVITVREGDNAPHFMNGRKGIYVRTDEFSSRYSSQLADERELRQLLQRRQLVRERRIRLVDRARERFATFTADKYAELGRGPKTTGAPKTIGARFDLSIGPRFPIHPLCDHAALTKVLKSTILPWRQVGFPRSTGGGFVSQHESAIILRPGLSFSILEATTWGMLFYASEIELHDEHSQGIHVPPVPIIRETTSRGRLV